MKALPRSLVSFDILDDLVAALMEKEKFRHTLKISGFENGVADEKDAQYLLQKIARITHEILDINDNEIREPKIILTNRLGKLSRQTVQMYLIFFPLCLFFLYMTFQHSDSGIDIWLIRMVILFLLMFPLIFRRRIRLNIEHDVRYVKYGDGLTTIAIDRLPAIQFQSYLAHEYAHHIYYHYYGEKGERWVREGWSRLVQWKVTQKLASDENNPAYLYHVLVQMISEMKFACHLLCLVFGRSLPPQVRWIRTLHQSNSLFNFLTGNPGYDVDSLMDHSVGTAFFFMAERHMGLKKTLWELPEMDEPYFDAKRDN